MEIKREHPVKRCAIIIANDRWGGDLLPGVAHDIDAIKSFLLSPAGGAWIPESIFDIVKPIGRNTFLQLLEKAVEEGYEYFFIYFGGHGELSKAFIPSFVLPGGEEVDLNSIKSVLSSKPALMISDSCQGIPEYGQGGTLNESQRMFSSGKVTENFRAARLFDRELRKLPPMFTYASAVSAGQFAGDTDAGGLYTQNLLQACNRIRKEEDKNQVVGICYPHMLASEAVLRQSGGKQKPGISGYNRSFQPPFLVIL